MRIHTADLLPGRDSACAEYQARRRPERLSEIHDEFSREVMRGRA